MITTEPTKMVAVDQVSKAPTRKTVAGALGAGSTTGAGAYFLAVMVSQRLAENPDVAQAMETMGWDIPLLAGVVLGSVAAVGSGVAAWFRRDVGPDTRGGC